MNAVAPLHGVRVLEVGTYLAASLAALHLTGLGAECVAVRRPATATGAAREAIFQPAAREALVAGKTVVTLDLTTSQGQTRMARLVKASDVLITNLAPETLTKLGIDAASLASINPTLIHVSMPGFASGETKDKMEVEVPPAAWEVRN